MAQRSGMGVELVALGVGLSKDEHGKIQQSENFYMPAELCNAVAPLYDEGSLIFDQAAVSYVEPISKRNRHAKQAVLFVELKCHLTE